MRYVKPAFYDTFACTADQCPDTCCAGWQIVIDEDTLEKYEQVQGSFRNRLMNSIDWEEGCFYQDSRRRCAFLNEKNLCDLYLALGEDGFCDTCRNYPRHTEEFEGIREYSLSLSCPVAARIILAQQGMPAFVEQEDEEEDELADEFEDFDLMLFTQLEDARNVLFSKMKEASGQHCIMDLAAAALELAEKMQGSVEEGCYFEIEDQISDFEKQEISQQTDSRGYTEKCELYDTMHRLERLREEWSDVLEEMHDTLYAGGAAAYSSICQEFENYLDADAERRKEYENISLQLLVFFVFTYFCGAVYDGWVYSKMALAVRSVEFIRELFLCRWKNSGKLDFEDYVELSYRYAREIEHSDQNLNELEEVFMEEITA